jgi:uncharacterized membrane protein
MTLTHYLACLAIVWIIKDSYIFSLPRKFIVSKSNYLKELFSCSLCLGFWSGVLMSLFIQYTTKSFSFDLFLYPFAVSGFCWFFDSALDLIQEYTFFYKSKREANSNEN